MAQSHLSVKCSVSGPCGCQVLCREIMLTVGSIVRVHHLSSHTENSVRIAAFAVDQKIYCIFSGRRLFTRKSFLVIFDECDFYVSFSAAI